MTGTPSRVGTIDWTLRTGGHLTLDEQRSLLGPLAKTHALNLAGRAAMLLHLNSGRRCEIPLERLTPPRSVLTRAASVAAERALSPALLNHSYRTYAFGAAIGVLEDVDVDRELLFAAAMLHDVGLMRTPDSGPRAERGADFTRESARVAREVAEEVGLSSAATATMRSAITMHQSPDVSPADGPEAYLLHAGGGVDVVGVRSWKLPPYLIDTVVSRHPRLGFKREFTAAFRAESDAVPQGRARFLRRYGAFDLAIKLAPFRE